MAKKTIRRALENLRAEETFNLITFSGDTKILFPGPVSPTQENLAAARKVLDGAYGSGGTEMMKAIRAALGDHEKAPKSVGGVEPVRVVCFMTDGYVGNDAEIVAEVQKHPEARVFSFGIGTAVNRFLLSKMAEAGRGAVEFVTKGDEAQAAADRFYERVHSPVLTNVSIEWNGLPVSEIYPARIPDLFSAKPVIITGRYAKAGKGMLVLKGTQGGGPFRREIPVDFGAENSSNAVLEKIWARRKVDDYMAQDWLGIQQGQSKYKAEIVQVGLQHSLATQYTSFVAVETRTVVQDGKPVRIEVPVELPEHVSPLAVPVVIGRFAPEYGTANGLMGNSLDFAMLTTVEVQAAAPMIETTRAQATNVFDDALLHPGEHVDLSKAEGVIDAAKHHAKEKAQKQDAARTARIALVQSKLSPELRQVYDCSLKAALEQVKNKCNLPASGKMVVQVRLSSATEDVLKKLSKVGMMIKSGEGSTTVTVEIFASKLEQLAQIAEVTAISQAKE